MRVFWLTIYKLTLILFFCNKHADLMSATPNNKLGFESASAAEAGTYIWKSVNLILNDLKLSSIFYQQAGRKGVLLTFYGIKDSSQWNRIAAQVKKKQKLLDWPTIYLEFRKQEIWIEKPNGVRERGKEEILVTIILNKKKHN